MNKLFRIIPLAGLLAASVVPLVLTPARAQEPAKAAPLISPDEMLSVDQLKIGMKGVGRSVFQGTKIEPFNVTVLGVLRKIDFGGDMILVRIDDGPPVTSGAGVSAGMSGSPIYVDGKLIGALAFAWPFAKQPLAGVTPIAQMLEDYRPGSSPRVSVAQSGSLQPEGGPLKLDGQLFARATVVPDRGHIPAGANGTLYMTPVATPVMVSGMGRVGLDELKRRFNRFSAVFAPGPGAVNLPEGEKPKLEPGAAIGVQLMGGDVDATAIGTVTYVKGNVVLGFGHPMFGLGTLNMPMTTAWIHGVMPSQEVSFKMGAPVETVGRLSQDRNWTIGGEVGEQPRAVDAEFVVSDKDRGVNRSYKVRAAFHRDLTPSLLYSSLMSAVGSVSPPNSGTTRGTVEVWAKGLPPIKRENVFAMGERRSAIEQLFGDPFAGMPLSELLQILDTLENSPFGSAPVERIRVAVDISEARRTATVERAYADRKRVKPGDKVKIGVVIRPSSGDKQTREVEVEIPPNIPGGRLLIGVAGGGSAERVRQLMQITRPPAKTLPQLVSQISEREQNNELVVELAQPVVGVSVAGREFPNLPNVVVEVLTSANPSGIRMIRSHTLQRHDTPWVLSGGQLLALQVDADEKDKSGAPLAAGAGGLGGFSSLLDLFRLGAGGGDFGGEIAGDATGDDVAALRMRLLQQYLAAAQNLPNDPPLPTFEELQKLLDSVGTDTAPGTSGGSSGVKTRGVGRGPGVWRFGAAKDFKGGRLDGVLVSSRGGLALAPQPLSLLTSPERFYWAQAGDGSGNVYVAGWLEGSIQRIGADGKTTTVFEGKDEVAITALTCGPDGTLFASAEPSGNIYRIEPSGQSTVLCKLSGQRVWCLQRSGDALYAGTGSEGKLYRISMDGKAEVALTAPDRHILSLAADGDRIYCATYPRGKVFRLEGGKVEPVYELPNLTTTALAVDKNHNLYLGTSPRATVVRLSPSGDATTLFSSQTEKHVFSLLIGPGGEVYAGVGPQARVYRIDPDQTVSTLWEPQAAYVLSLSLDGSGSLFATTAGPTQIVRLAPRPAGSGTFTSSVLNAGNVARWGAVRWSGPEGQVSIQTRSGNTAYPDATWSGWSEGYSKAEGQPIASPPGQYLQYRVTLQGKEGAPAPLLRGMELFYRARNRAPVVTVRSPGSGEAVAGQHTIQWSGKDPDGDRLSYDLYYAPEGSDKWVKIGSQVSKPEGEDAVEEVPEEEESKLPPAVTLGGKARTGAAHRVPGTGTRTSVSRRPRVPVQTPVPFTLPGTASEIPGVETPDEAEVTLLTGGETGANATFKWNTSKIPEGRYRVRIVATDSLTSPDEPGKGEAVSEVFRIDNSAPEIRLSAAKRQGHAPPAEVVVAEKSSYVASAEYRVDTGEWFAAAAADGIFDSPEETIRIDPSRLPAGRHTLFIRARDAAGNQSWAKTVYVKK